MVWPGSAPKIEVLRSIGIVSPTLHGGFHSHMGSPPKQMVFFCWKIPMKLDDDWGLPPCWESSTSTSQWSPPSHRPPPSAPALHPGMRLRRSSPAVAPRCPRAPPASGPTVMENMGISWDLTLGWWSISSLIVSQFWFNFERCKKKHVSSKGMKKESGGWSWTRFESHCWACWSQIPIHSHVRFHGYIHFHHKQWAQKNSPFSCGLSCPQAMNSLAPEDSYPILSA